MVRLVKVPEGKPRLYGQAKDSDEPSPLEVFKLVLQEIFGPPGTQEGYRRVRPHVLADMRTSYYHHLVGIKLTTNDANYRRITRQFPTHKDWCIDADKVIAAADELEEIGAAAVEKRKATYDLENHALIETERAISELGITTNLFVNLVRNPVQADSWTLTFSGLTESQVRQIVQTYQGGRKEEA